MMNRHGIFNIVEEVAGSGILVVKCRVKSHMENLRRVMVGLGPTNFEIERDYPYRAMISRDDLALGMARLAMEIDYPKTKPEVGKLGEKVSMAMMECWSTLTGIEEDPNRIQHYFQAGFDEEYFARRYGGRSTIRTLPSVTGPDYEFFPYHSSDYDGKYKLVEKPGKKRKRRRRNRR